MNVKRFIYIFDLKIYINSKVERLLILVGIIVHYEVEGYQFDGT